MQLSTKQGHTLVLKCDGAKIISTMTWLAGNE